MVLITTSLLAKALHAKATIAIAENYISLKYD